MKFKSKSSFLSIQTFGILLSTMVTTLSAKKEKSNTTSNSSVKNISPVLINKLTSKDSFSIKSFGNSMKPILLDGDILKIKKTNFKNTYINDIITLKIKDHLVTHRVVYKDAQKKLFITKGDNNFHPDKPVKNKDILGILTEVTRDEKKIKVDELYLMYSSTYYHEITSISNSLRKNKIQFTILKGLPLHTYYEGSFPKRFYADCDILIHPTDYPKVRNIFKNHNYFGKDPDISSVYEIQFSKVVLGIQVTFDIHLKAVFLMTQLTRLNSLYPEKLLSDFSSELIKTSRTINFGQTKLNILKKEYLIIYLLLHIFHHNFTGYNRYGQLANIIKKEKLDQDLLLQIISKYRLGNYIYPTLILQNKYYPQTKLKSLLEKIPVQGISKSKLKKLILKVDIFTDQPRLTGGIERFYLIFTLSPNRYLRYMVFLNWDFYKSLPLVFAKLIRFFLNNFFLKNKFKTR